jgi:hypothetical protein
MDKNIIFMDVGSGGEIQAVEIFANIPTYPH